MRRVGLAIVGVGLLAGCAGETPRYAYPPPPPPPRYEPPPLPRAPELGPATLVGRIAGGWTCEGQSVVLLPATQGTVSRMQALYLSTTSATAPVEAVRKRAASPAAGVAEPPVASGTCSDQAGFTLPGLRPGTYFVVARARPRSGPGAESYALMRRVDLRPAETALVTLPEADSPAPRRAPRRGPAARTGAGRLGAAALRRAPAPQ